MKLKMNGGKNKGYTIIEVMIVLAITGVMFLLAAVFISGKQDEVAFRQSVTDLNTDIQAAINDVTNGFYPTGSGDQFNCSAGAGGSQPTIVAGTNGQGTNNGCIFLGKVLYFWTDAGGSKGYEIMSVAGNSTDSSGNPVQSLVDAKPTPIITTGVDATDYKSLENGLVFPDTNAVKESCSGCNDYAFAIFNNLANNNLNSSSTPGVRAVSLYSMGSPPVTAGKPQTAVQNSVKNISDSNIIDKVTVCVTNGDRQAYITIGGSGKLTTDITWGACP
ncbi:MAG TPA: prepilin-type N-terminal cleavage/methylation domain-containing protein [Candidatus Saccharimonadales bacterium]|nr:prepilin-type N-terminal cleavage/methylation domain-containing protein [Candidatus Saccharimonadales bacterium]